MVRRGALGSVTREEKVESSLAEYFDFLVLALRLRCDERWFRFLAITKKNPLRRVTFHPRRENREGHTHMAGGIETTSTQQDDQPVEDPPPENVLSGLQLQEKNLRELRRYLFSRLFQLQVRERERDFMAFACKK